MIQLSRTIKNTVIMFNNPHQLPKIKALKITRVQDLKILLELKIKTRWWRKFKKLILITPITKCQINPLEKLIRIVITSRVNLLNLNFHFIGGGPYNKSPKEGVHNNNIMNISYINS